MLRRLLQAPTKNILDFFQSGIVYKMIVMLIGTLRIVKLFSANEQVIDEGWRSELLKKKNCVLKID